MLGQIPNSNAQHISEALAAAGIEVYRHEVVGDNLSRIVDTLSGATARADVIITTGGLGPTSDDITRAAVAEAFGRALKRDERLVAMIEGVFRKMGRDMPASNLRQADLPDGAVAIDAEGTAPGFHIEHEGTVLFALPGVPWEMKAMLAKSVLPELRRRAGEGVILSREILVMGLGESATQEKVGDIVERSTNPTIGYLAGHGQVRLRLTAKADSENAALGLIRPLESELRDRLGDDAVEGHASSMPEAFGEFLRARGLTVAVAESLTGGAMAAELSLRGGSSDFFLGGLVVYATESKRDVAEIDDAILQGPGAVSEEAATALAESAAKHFGADLGLSATGVAGPAEQEGKPVGTVYVGATFDGGTEVRRVRGYGDRANIRGIAISAALDLGRRVVLARG